MRMLSCWKKLWRDMSGILPSAGWLYFDPVKPQNLKIRAMACGSPGSWLANHPPASCDVRKDFTGFSGFQWKSMDLRDTKTIKSTLLRTMAHEHGINLLASPRDCRENGRSSIARWKGKHINLSSELPERTRSLVSAPEHAKQCAHFRGT